MRWRGAVVRLLWVSSIVLVAVLLLRYAVLEAGVFPSDCKPLLADGPEGLCLAKWALVQTFMQQRLGWASLILGVLAFVSRRRSVAWGGWLCGIAGLVLYSFDYAAVGAMLSLLVLARDGIQARRGEEQAGREPGDGLRVEGLR
ncbi:hypothetical protein SAMN05421829_11582 [Aromatoleum tolulyticum]|uniref:Uncharacterized protein n=1 Tax=Aromatoleum tolulyticum TaxID=34027 RepID=A0A1N7AWQ7_9RHOO|nr:hypothetical protein [Aromatoleum tolulyticum]SIR43393.1 hypothetical protein SAMN05421829_11582 [Aromatoleum tolulyticum]